MPTADGDVLTFPIFMIHANMTSHSGGQSVVFGAVLSLPLLLRAGSLTKETRGSANYIQESAGLVYCWGFGSWLTHVKKQGWLQSATALDATAMILRPH